MTTAKPFRYGAAIGLDLKPETPGFFGGTYEDSIRRSAAAGYDSVEIHLRDPKELPIDEVSRALEETGLAVAGLGTGRSYSMDGLSLIDEETEIRGRAAQRLKDHVDLAAHFDKTIVSIGLMRGFVRTADRKTCIHRLRESVLQIADHASKKGVGLTIEAINRFDIDYLLNLYETADFVDSVGYENFGLHIDTNHMNVEDSEFYNTIVDCKKWINYCHYADSNRLIPGAGNIDFQEVTQALRDIQFDHHIVLACLAEPEPEEAARAGLDYCKAIETIVTLRARFKDLRKQGLEQ